MPLEDFLPDIREAKERIRKRQLKGETLPENSGKGEAVDIDERRKEGVIGFG